jgi:hypothetical protein
MDKSLGYVKSSFPFQELEANVARKPSPVKSNYGPGDSSKASLSTVSFSKSSWLIFTESLLKPSSYYSPPLFPPSAPRLIVQGPLLKHCVGAAQMFLPPARVLQMLMGHHKSFSKAK